MSYIDILQAQLTVDEGHKNFMYKDTKGIPTIGIGHNLNKPISDRAVQVIFEDDMADAESDARKLVQNFDALSDARRAVVVNMSFNLGFERFSLFHDTLAAINAGRFDDAAAGMLASAWATQVGDRAQRLAKAMREG